MPLPLERGRTPDNSPLLHPEQKEGLPYKGRLGVFFGGSGGTGLTAAIEWQKLGGTVVMGASSEKTLKRALVNVRFAKGDPTAITPLVGDVTDTEKLASNIASLEKIVDETEPTEIDVFSFAAAGMPFAVALNNDYLEPMNKIVQENPPDAQEQLERKKAALREQLHIWLPESEDAARLINVGAKKNIVHGFLDCFGGKVPMAFLDTNSIFGKAGKGPLFYGNVLLKHEFTVWAQEHADEIAEAGMDMAEYIAEVIEDSDVGRFFLTKVKPLLKPNLQEALVRTKVKRADVFNAEREFLDMTREQRAQYPRPFQKYIVGDNGLVKVVDHIPEELHIDATQFDI